MISQSHLHGWIPSQYTPLPNGDARIGWTLRCEERLLDPFYEQSMARQMAKPFHQLFRRTTGVADLLAFHRTNPGLPLRGLVFHMSRCGSTLLSQMLAASPRNVVLSEPAPFDGAVRAKAPDRIERIRAVASALAQPRAGSEDRAYFKLDCWHIHEIATLRAAFPDTPWIFLYRDPLEVMVSHARMPAVWTIPGMLDPRALGMAAGDGNPAELDRYAARSLALICEAALRAVRSHGGLLIHYADLPAAFASRIAAHFGIDDAELPQLLEASRRDAKSPQADFVADSMDKQRAATGRMRDLVEQYLRPVYRQLETMRATQQAASREEAMVAA